MAKRKRLTRDEARAQTVEHLLDAAEAVFRAKGFEKATLAEIADRAGYTKGAIYANFADKGALFSAVAERWNASSVGELFETVAAASSADDLLRRIVRWTASEVATSITDYPLNGDFWVLAARADERRARTAAAFAEGVDFLTEVIDSEAARHGVELVVPPRTVASLLIDLQYGMFLRSNLEHESIGDDLLAIALAAAFGRRPPQP